MSRDSIAKVLIVALLVCVACSILVSAAAIGLKTRQEANKKEEKRRNILQIARLYNPAQPVDLQFSKVQSRIVDLASGEFVGNIDPAAFDSRRAAQESGSRYLIPADLDLAGIKVRPQLMDVYLVEEGGALQQLILPVYGKGLWSTMYGFIALKPDLTTVSGFGFYEHGETPGLGGEIDNRSWLAKWPGKSVYDKAGEVKLHLIKGTVATSAATSGYGADALSSATTDVSHQVDGLSGATLTSRGVNNLLAYWLGANGYLPLIETLRRRGGIQP